MLLKITRANGIFPSIVSSPRHLSTGRRLLVKPSASTRQLKSVLIANRGEIALRVARTAKIHGVKTTALYTDPDAHMQHALKSDNSVSLGDASGYLDGDRIIRIAQSQGCDCVHPGYGFLSENSTFAQKCADAGLIFIGPPPAAIEAMGNKSRSKDIMTAAGVPCIPGYHGVHQAPDFLLIEAQKIGFPVLLKAVKGGGGKGMRISLSENDFKDKLASAKSEAQSSFGDDTMLVEKYITTPRHIEVQIFADKHGNCVALGERDCSLQRRHQKIIEESPAPNLDDRIRKDLWQKACNAALAVGYEGAGTVEFIFDNDAGEFFFMEMNTRLQVEHPVTEMVTGQDLVHWQLQVAEGKELPLTQEEIEQRIGQLGWAFEARIYAEDPDRGFIPDSGILIHMQAPTASEHVRVDTGFIQGDLVSSHYDPMIAKLIVRGSSRQEALQRLLMALQAYEVTGLITNIEFLKRICSEPDFAAGLVETGFIEKHREHLFAKRTVAPVVWAHAAIGLALQEQLAQTANQIQNLPRSSHLGFGIGYGSRTYGLSLDTDNVEPGAGAVDVKLRQRSHQTFDVSVCETTFENVHATLIAPHKVEARFPHSQMRSTVVSDGHNLSVFHNGHHYHLRQSTQQWIHDALGNKDVANSVLAPMPCKILRVDVEKGEKVYKDQVLLAIESMKMETLIRSPQDGVISRIMHNAGDICKAGTTLVEFEDSPSDAQ